MEECVILLGCWKFFLRNNGLIFGYEYVFEINLEKILIIDNNKW